MAGYDPEIERIHQQGVAFSSHGFYGEASVTLHDAQILLAGLEPTPVNDLHNARIDRDLGLNALRGGGDWKTHIEASLGTLFYLYDNSLLDEKVICAELGAALTARARGESYTGNGPDARSSYRRAHSLLRRGNNSYFLTNNDVLSARECRANGEPLRAMGWLALAGAGVARAAFKDRNNFIPACRTFVKRAPDALTKTRAVRASQMPGRR